MTFCRNLLFQRDTNVFTALRSYFTQVSVSWHANEDALTAQEKTASAIRNWKTSFHSLI